MSSTYCVGVAERRCGGSPRDQWAAILQEFPEICPRDCKPVIGPDCTPAKGCREAVREPMTVWYRIRP